LKEFMGWFGEFSGARAEINELIDTRDQVLVGITLGDMGSRAAWSPADSGVWPAAKYPNPRVAPELSHARRRD
jgi:hypothetical protein